MLVVVLVPPKLGNLAGSVLSFNVEAPEDVKDGPENDKVAGKEAVVTVVVPAGLVVVSKREVVVVVETGLTSVELAGWVVVVALVPLRPRPKPSPKLGFTSLEVVEPVAGVVIVVVLEPSPPKPKDGVVEVVVVVAAGFAVVVVKLVEPRPPRPPKPKEGVVVVVVVEAAGVAVVVVVVEVLVPTPPKLKPKDGVVKAVVVVAGFVVVPPKENPLVDPLNPPKPDKPPNVVLGAVVVVVLEPSPPKVVVGFPNKDPTVLSAGFVSVFVVPKLTEGVVVVVVVGLAPKLNEPKPPLAEVLVPSPEVVVEPKDDIAGVDVELVAPKLNVEPVAGCVVVVVVLAAGVVPKLKPDVVAGWVEVVVVEAGILPKLNGLLAVKVVEELETGRVVVLVVELKLPEEKFKPLPKPVAAGAAVVVVVVAVAAGFKLPKLRLVFKPLAGAAVLVVVLEPKLNPPKELPVVVDGAGVVLGAAVDWVVDVVVPAPKLNAGFVVVLEEEPNKFVAGVDVLAAEPNENGVLVEEGFVFDERGVEVKVKLNLLCWLFWPNIFILKIYLNYFKRNFKFSKFKWIE